MVEGGRCPRFRGPRQRIIVRWRGLAGKSRPVRRAGGERQFVIEGEGNVRVLHDEVAVERAGIAQVFEDGLVDLEVLLQPRMAVRGIGKESAGRSPQMTTPGMKRITADRLTG